MKKLFVTFFICIAFFGSYAQTYLFNSSTTAITTCAGTLYDDGGASGNYTASQVYTMTITPSTPGTAVQLDFTSWDVSPGSSLVIYNGPTTASPQLGFPWDDLVSPVGIQIMATASNPTGQLTLQWTTGPAASGFAATITCNTPCQQILVTIDDLLCVPNMANEYIDVCYGSPVTFSAHGTYPENNAAYAQSDATSLFIWTFGDGTIDTGQVVTYTYPNATGYDFSVRVEDIMGCENINWEAARVRHSANPIVDVKPLPDICAEETIDVTVGTNALSTFVINQTQGGASGTLSVADTTYLPDGSGASYTSTVTYTEFIPGATLTNISDFLGVCASMFHSYSGDLEIRLQCPNGTIVMLADQPGGGVQFGEPPVTAASGSSAPCYGNMGVPYDYCWTTTPIYGTMVAEAAGAPSHTFTNVCGNTLTEEYYPAGSYAPESPFTAFLGCPLNGNWSILITDHLGLDEGYITAWSISINPTLIPGGWTYDVPIDSIGWTGPYLTETSDSTAEITPTAAGTFQYTMTVYDAYGCNYDTTFSVEVLANPEPDLGPDTTACEGTSISLNAGPGNQYFWSNGQITQSTTFDQTGIYAVTVTNSNGSVACYGADTVEIVIIPWASVNLGPDLCETAAVTLDAQNPGFDYHWSNGASTQTTNITSTGIYSVTVSYGGASECSDVDSINVNVIPTPVVNLGPDQEMCRHEFRDYDVSQTTPQYTYLWSTGSLSPYLHVEGLPVGSVAYSVTVSGCDSRSDTVLVDVIACDLTIPNIITPNGDGYNDVFAVENLPYYPNSVLMVFNRWGKKIYETANYLNDWDGEKFADGTYFMVLKVNYGNEEYEDHHGTLTIMRD